MEAENIESGIHPESEKKDIGYKGMVVDYKRGAGALLRLTLQNHIYLSDLADRKAGLLISINTIAMSIIGTSLFPKLGENKMLVIPTIVLVMVSLVVIIMSVISTRPNVPKGTFTETQVKNKAVNLLFFGNFHHMSLHEFQWATHEMVHDKEYLFDAITQDIWGLGKVVARKYRYLHYAYNAFMYGMIISVIAFGISYLIYDKMI